MLRLNAEASDRATMERIRDQVLDIVRGARADLPRPRPMREDDPVTTIEPWLRDILRCPSCRATLVRTGPDGNPEFLGCPSAYRIDDGIPVLLVDEARSRA